MSFETSQFDENRLLDEACDEINKLKADNERLSGERDRLARALFVIRSLTMRGRGDEQIANLACDAVRDIDETPLFQLKQPVEGE